MNFFNTIRNYSTRYLSGSRARPIVFAPLPPKRDGEHVMSFLQNKLLAKYDPTGQRRKLAETLRAGDMIKVTYGDKSTAFGRIIAIKRGHNNVGHNILMRNKIGGLGVEVRVPLFNPTIKNIEVMHKPEKYLSRRKHFYIRNTKHDVGNIEDFLTRERIAKNQSN
ncbi:54S ribosomal protein Img1p, mitochondrial [[Candida] jaroonii]|uniref:54S ribosomal protein Img1p, mitochondrial n=1 Tax=[Candida] jaroonii TaxID=467808 RepID=A0ACA9YFG0_9ASCO|nr:54S ribosomal protein Img1p, mitochondrial [[Candida] jaroonii]